MHVTFDVNWIFSNTLAMLRPHTEFWVFDQAKNRTLAALSTFCEFLKIKTSLELLNVIFENNLPKGIFG